MTNIKKGSHHTAEAIKKMSDIKKGKVFTDEHRKNISASVSGEKNHNFGRVMPEEQKKKISDAVKGENHPLYGKHHTEEAIERMSNAHKTENLSEETRELMRLNHADVNRENNGMYGKHQTEETKKKQSDGMMGKYTGEKHWNWQDGKSYEPYCQKFNEEFKEKIREQYGRQCFICGMTEEQNGRKLCIHHINYDKNCLCNESKCYFVPLCMSCHGKTNNNRWFWERLLTACCEDEYMALYFDKDFKVDIWHIDNVKTVN